MAKKGPLGKAETFYIDNHYEDVDALQLATDLDRTVSSIKKYIKTCVDNKSSSFTKAGDHFNSKKGSTVMTENASTIADENKLPSTPRQNHCVTKIKNE